MRDLILRFASRLRFPWLFVLTAVLAIANFVVPDPIPLLDELVLALLALTFGAWRRRDRGPDVRTRIDRELGTGSKRDDAQSAPRD